jgi:hypothetical protein
MSPRAGIKAKVKNIFTLPGNVCLFLQITIPAFHKIASRPKGFLPYFRLSTGIRSLFYIDAIYSADERSVATKMP